MKKKDEEARITRMITKLFEDHLRNKKLIPPAIKNPVGKNMKAGYLFIDVELSKGRSKKLRKLLKKPMLLELPF